MNVLVTGASGFIGRFLSPFLRAKGHNVVELSSKNCDLRKETSLECFREPKFDQIYHLAAWTQAGDFCLRHPGEQWLINQQIHTHLLDFWQRDQPQALLIALGTSCAYDPLLPLEEEYYLSGIPTESLLSYAMTKRMLLAGLQAFHQQFGLNYLYVVPSTLYGPKYSLDGRQMHFIFDLVHKIIAGRDEGVPVVLWGDGEQVRELIHVEDFISILWELTLREKNMVSNIGAGEGYTIREFARQICEIVGYPLDKVQFDLSRYAGARSKVLSIRLLQERLGRINGSLRPLSQGLQELVQWFQQEKRG